MPFENAIVVGAGIVGLAIARSLAERGVAVTVFERAEKAVGASVRNFGMLWPIGQPAGALYERALRSKHIWKGLARNANLWYEEAGSLHLAYTPLEWQVLQEFAAASPERPLHLLTPRQTLATSNAVNGAGLIGALFSRDEAIVESRVALEKLPAFLSERYGVQFQFGTAISHIDHPTVFAGKRHWQADHIFICSGADFETLYSDVFAQHHFTKCKLQMMRLVAQPGNWRIGPSLCAGLSLMHYNSFAAAPALPQLKQLFQNTMPDYVKWGIHVMVSQNGEGELTVGDSHEYGSVHTPFHHHFINQLIIDYLKTFARFKDWAVHQTWNGVYAKKTDGKTEFVFSPEPGVTLVNGFGGAGMTLSFGLADEVVAAL